MSYFSSVSLDTNNAAGDAFSRLRISPPEYVFDASFQYDLQPLIYEQITAETGAAIAHDSTNRCATLTLASTPTGGQATMQSYEQFRYQPGRSQMAIMTFNFIETAANVTKFIGYSDGSNGIELQQVGTTVQFALLSDSAKGDETVAQASWNVDTFDGSGDENNPSGITLDLTKTHILVIDFQWLGVGRVRVGFDIDGVIYVAHEFLHANVQTVPYWQHANLPVRAGMTCSDTSSTTMRFICASVISEGGQSDVAGYPFSLSLSGTAGNDTRAYIGSIRPKTTFNSIANRSKFVLEGIDVVVTGSSPVKWELCLGQAVTTPSYADVNATYSGTEYDTAGTLSGSPAIVIASGYVAASNQSKSSASRSLSSRYPITLDAAGAVRSLGTLTLLATGIGGTSATQASIAWREIR